MKLTSTLQNANAAAEKKKKKRGFHQEKKGKGPISCAHLQCRSKEAGALVLIYSRSVRVHLCCLVPGVRCSVLPPALLARYKGFHFMAPSTRQQNAPGRAFTLPSLSCLSCRRGKNYIRVECKIALHYLFFFFCLV